jgi:hypothetical protein
MWCEVLALESDLRGVCARRFEIIAWWGLTPGHAFPDHALEIGLTITRLSRCTGRGLDRWKRCGVHQHGASQMQAARLAGRPLSRIPDSFEVDVAGEPLLAALLINVDAQRLRAKAVD